MLQRPHYQTELLEPRTLLAVANVIQNGGFQRAISFSDWNVSGNMQADSRFGTYNSGPGYAYLSNVDGSAGNSLAGSMYQQVTIPSTATSLTLNFFSRITTSETTTTVANDTMTVSIMDSTGTTTLQTLKTLSNLNANTAYAKQTIFLNRSLIGQTVRLVFNASTNATLPTTFRVDDVSLIAVSPATSNRVVGYLPQYRYSSFSKMDLSALTHINYFSISLTAANDGTLSTGGVTTSNLATVVDAMHAIGGTVSITVGPISFSTVAASATARAAFATNVVNYALQYNLDGIDIDWEPPAGNNVANYALLINDLYTVANPQKMLITAAVNPWTNEIPVTAVNTKMDWLNVMCYDFSYANHSTYSDAVSGMVDWTNYGVTKNKIVMGVPFYGRQGTSWSATTSSTYTTISSSYFSSNGAYPAPAIDYATGFYYNGVETIRKKAEYVTTNSYGGMMIWELGQDHWNGSNNYDPWSLLPVIKAGILPSTTISSISATPADNTVVAVGSTQNVSVTVNANAPSAGVLQVSLIGSNAATPRDFFYVSTAGAVSRTFNLSLSQSVAGSQLYEVYVQFRPNVTSGPYTDVLATDAVKLKPLTLNWQNFPSAPATPTPADGALLTSAPAVFDWADAPNATSYDVYVDGAFRQNVANSQWTRTIALTPGVTHNWQVIAKNAYGSASSPLWTFAYDVTAPSFSSASYNIDTRTISFTASESIGATAVAAFLKLLPDGLEVSAGNGTVAGSTLNFAISAALDDGDYTFRLPAGSVRDAAGNYNASDWSTNFFFLRGDANRDRKVDTQDFNVLATHFGGGAKVFSQGDFNYDGVVNSTDFDLLVAQYGKKLAAPAPLAAGAALFGGTSLSRDSIEI